MKTLPTLVAVVLTATFSLSLPAQAANGDCGQPLSIGGDPTASDALFVLRTAVGAETCELVVCDVDSSCAVTASDALRILRIAVGQELLLNCSGCGPSTTTTSTTTTTTLGAATWNDVFAVFQATGCTNNFCHGGGFSNALLGDLDDLDAGYDALVGVASSQNIALARVDPFDPDASYLVSKLDNTQLDVGGFGSRMPVGLAPLTRAQIATVRSWILAGALKN